MSEFRPRLDTPKYGNKYYNTKSNGGYNPCIRGNYPYNSANPTGYPGLTVLPNCTGYATGRFAEIIGEPKCQYLGNTNAKNYCDLARKQGLEVGKEPRLGACVVWTDNEYGHVGIVEKMIDDTTILISESGWFSRTPVWWATHRKGNGDWVNGTDYSWMKACKLLGFIYNPAVEEDMTKKETEDLIKELVPQIIAQMDADKAKLPADDWAKNAINMCIARGIMVGYPDGFHAQSDIRREEVAQIVANLTAKE